MAGAAAKNPNMQGLEYTIYTYDQPRTNQKGQIKWEKKDTADDMGNALKKAEALFSSGDYQKVEVKQKYFDKKKNRNVDMTLRVYEAKAKKPIGAVHILIIAFLLGVMAFALTYFLATR